MATRDDGGLQPVVNTQPRAASTSASKGISTLSIVTESLRGRGELEFETDCLCFSTHRGISPLPASALIIGRKSQGRNNASQDSDSRLHHVLSLKNHLSDLNVKIFKYSENYQGTHYSVSETISQFFSKQDVFLFILYYSGPTDDEGEWLFTTTAYGVEHKDYIRLDTIAMKWKERSSGWSQLLIIVDADNSGVWVEKAGKYESDSNISIMASSGSKVSWVDGQYTLSLIGKQGEVFYPLNVRQNINRFLSVHPCVPTGFCCYLVRP